MRRLRRSAMGPEWICHRCHSFDLSWQEIQGKGRIYSYQRPHHPVHAALNGHGPYLAVLVELPEHGNIRMVGNLQGIRPVRDDRHGRGGFRASRQRRSALHAGAVAHGLSPGSQNRG